MSTHTAVSKDKLSTDESRRIQDVYAKRDASGKRRLYSRLSPAALYASQSVERALGALLRRLSLTDLASREILDLGCGNGATLRTFLSFGAEPARCRGIDLLPDRIDEARRLSPNMDFICSNAEKLPYEDDSFDIIISFTVFSSILDRSMSRNLANEMQRVLKRNGIVIWYDFLMDNPSNPDVRGMKALEIRGLFEGCDCDLRRVTLAPPLARAVAPFSFIACDLLEKLYLLRTHYLGAIRKR